jgi:hypothetical protein
MRFAADLERFEAALEDALVAERERREAARPHPGEICRRAEKPATRLCPEPER